MLDEKININLDIFEDQDEHIIYYKEPEEKLYEKYFENTLTLKNNIKNNDFIIYLKDKNENIIGRKFLKKDKKPGYEEYFIWKDLEFFSELSKSITYIFPPGEGKNLEKIIGFRFFEEDPTTLNGNLKYFTLVLKDEKKFDILEINSKVKNNNGISFIEEKLNCFDIIEKIIKQKFTDKITYNYPCTVIELLGFYYSLMYEKEHKNDNIKFIEPYYPIINNKTTMREAIREDDIISDKLFIEPILFNKHISVLYFKFENKKRKNILFDPSLFHFNSITSDKGIFPKTMRINFHAFPKYSCQSGPSCSIWFMSQIIVALKYGNNLFNNNDEYNYINLIRMMEYINKFINIDENPLIYGVKDIIKSKSINISSDKKCIISHKIAFASFLNIFGTINNFCYIDGTILDFIIDDIKLKFEKIREFICNSQYSKKYYEYLEIQSDITIEEIDKMKEEFKALQNKYELFIKELLNSENDNQKFVLKNNIISLLDKSLEKLHNKFTCKIYEKEEIKNFFRQKNDIFGSFNK